MKKVISPKMVKNINKNTLTEFTFKMGTFLLWSSLTFLIIVFIFEYDLTGFPWFNFLALLTGSGLITYFVSKSRILSKIILAIVALLSIFSVFYIPSDDTVSPSGAFGYALGVFFVLLFASTFWIITAGILPVLLQAISSNKNQYNFDKNYWLCGIIVPIVAALFMILFSVEHSRFLP